MQAIPAAPPASHPPPEREILAIRHPDVRRDRRAPAPLEQRRGERHRIATGSIPEHHRAARAAAPAARAVLGDRRQLPDRLPPVARWRGRCRYGGRRAATARLSPPGTPRSGRRSRRGRGRRSRSGQRRRDSEPWPVIRAARRAGGRDRRPMSTSRRRRGSARYPGSRARARRRGRAPRRPRPARRRDGRRRGSSARPRPG